MQRTANILKRRQVEAPTNPEPQARSRSTRIPRRRIQQEGGDELPDASAMLEAAPLVLRGVQASEAAVPYRMAELALDPDFPLPEIDTAPVDEPAAPDVAVLEAAWKARREEAVAQARIEAYKEGYEHGYAAAEEALQGAFDQRRGELQHDVARLQAAWQDFLKKSEPLLATLAFEVVRQLLEAPLPQDVRAVSAQALAQAVERFGDDTPVEISLHPDDLTRLQAYGLVADLEALHAGVRWNPNPDIEMGDWIAQSPDAAIRRLKEEMIDQLKSRLGLLSIMKKRTAE